MDGCGITDSVSMGIIVTVSPIPDAMATPVSQTVCSGSPITTIVLTGSVGGTTFNWTRDNTGTVTGIAASGAGDISGTLTNTTNAPIMVTFTITPDAGGCSGTPISATVTVNPAPDAVATPPSQTVCSGTAITTIVLSGSVGGTTYNWTRDNTVNLTGIAASGSGNISGTLTNTTNVQQTTTFTITPTANGCPGTPITATVAVNPTPTVSPVPPNQTVCNNALTAPVNFSGPVAGTTFNWTNNTPSIGLAASGTGNIASFSAINLTNAPVTATITVTPVTLSTASVNFNYTGAVQTWVVPAGVTSVNIQAFGAQGNANASGVSMGGLGGSATGTLAVTPGETLWINVGGGGVTSITGGFNGGGNAGTAGTCLLALGGGGGGASDVRQTANTLANRKIVAGGGGGTAGNRVAACARGAGGGGGGGYYGGGGGCGYPGTAGVVPTGGTQAAGGAGGITGTTFGATNGLPGVLGIGGDGGNEIQSNQAGSQAVIFGSGDGGGLTGSPGQQSGLNNFTGQSGAGGSSYIGGVTSGSTTAGVRSGNGLVTISYASGGPSCSGPPVSFTITVNPTPNAVATPSTQTICSGTAMTPIVLSGNVSGTTFNWVRNNTVNVTGIANSGSGNISGTPVNNTAVQQTVTYTITPTANGCAGAPITATLIVNIAPTITCPANITVNNDPGVCGAIVTYPPATATGSPAPVITYSQASGTFFPVGTTTVTATATNTCGVATCTFTITVLDVQVPTITCPANITANTNTGVCTATIAVPNPTTADNCAVTQLTWVMTGATVASSPATGINNIGTFTFNLNGTTGTGVTTIVYTVKDAAGNSATCSFTVTVNDAWIPVISGQPTNQTVCVGTDAAFMVTASVPAGNPLTYQWQAWNGATWVNIAGATAATLPLTAVPFSLNTSSYRCILTGRCSVVTSGFATLYVNQLPTVSILASRPPSLLPGQLLTLTAVVSPGGGSYQWFKNGVAMAGATGSSLVNLTVSDIGSYTCRYTDQNGCIKTSDAMTVSGQTSESVFIYPNPNTGHFHVRVYNQPNEEITIRVFDMKGRLMYQRKEVTNLAYTDIEVEMMADRITASETYLVTVSDGSGNVIGSKKIQILK
jgi:PKD-like domain/Secretion system C-terminal sorting domain/Glycine rich protein/HYR domain